MSRVYDTLPKHLGPAVATMATACDTTPEAVLFAMLCLKVSGLDEREMFEVLSEIARDNGSELVLSPGEETR
jgi:hypothetical protein